MAIDGSKIRAVASKKAVTRKVDLQRTQQAISEEIAHYLSRLDNADQDESGETTDRKAVQAALTRLQQRQAGIDDEIERMEGSDSTLSVQGEPQARAMKSLHGAPGYNLQTGLSGAKGELSLAVLAYNLKRLTNWKGARWTMAAIRA